MNASKETARKANKSIEDAASTLDEIVDIIGAEKNNPLIQKLKKHLCYAQNFVEAAERKLPTEAAYKRDAERRTKKLTGA